MKENEFFKAIIKNGWQNLIEFASVGASGAMINLLLIWLLTNYAHLFYMVSALISIEISLLWNFILNTKFTFKYKFESNNILLDSLIKYHLASLLTLFINLFSLFILTEFIKIHYIISEALAILLAFGLNYALSVNYVWNRRT